MYYSTIFAPNKSTMLPEEAKAVNFSLSKRNLVKCLNPRSAHCYLMKKNEYPGNVSVISQKFSHYKLSFLTIFYDSNTIIYFFQVTVVQWTDRNFYDSDNRIQIRNTYIVECWFRSTRACSWILLHILTTHMMVKKKLLMLI